jgi:meso-butanediol dehydrogenase/(S,S)-butanediol dehydrogenase/diacetyl reductase
LLEGQPAIVTGGGQGVGRGIALALAAEGAPVALLGRTEMTMLGTCDEVISRGGRAMFVVCDVRELEDIERAVDQVLAEFGGLRILINNAQILPSGFLLDIDERLVDEGWRSGPLAAFRLMRACHSHLRNGGAIVNISSGAAYAAGPPGLGVYAAVKSALQTLSRAAAVEWASDGIRVNAILPLAQSPGLQKWVRRNSVQLDTVLGNVPLGRIGDAERDVGRAVVFLVGPDAGMITGTTLPVDGGGLYLR